MSFKGNWKLIMNHNRLFPLPHPHKNLAFLLASIPNVNMTLGDGGLGVLRGLFPPCGLLLGP